MKPFFSIIIPTLNEEKFLPNLLDNLCRQKDKNFEVIIADGNSSDKTKKVVTDFSDKLPLNFFQVNKRNVSYQRNYGAKKAKGEYLIFLDADSGITSLFTAKLEKIIFKKGGLLFIPYITPDSYDSQIKLFFQLANSVIEISQLVGKPLSSGGSMIVERNFFHLIKGFPENVFLSEDHQFVDKAFGWGVKGKFLSDPRIKFSLRRMKKEGKLKLLTKVIYSFLHFILKGKVNKKIFEYEMGGHLYFNKKKKITIEQSFKKYLHQLKGFFDQLF